MQEIITITIVFLAVIIAVRSIVKGLIPQKRTACSCGGRNITNVPIRKNGKCNTSVFEQDRCKTVNKDTMVNHGKRIKSDLCQSNPAP